MQERPSWLPDEVDLERPSAARCYDYFLGGSCNFESDRELGREVESAVPNIRQIALDNRAFLRRVVRFCLDRGIRQFLDLGSGIPTVGNVHEIAHRIDPHARVVYVDNEPVAVAHSKTILQDNENASIVHADCSEVDGILAAPETRALLDFSQPVAVMMVALLHFVPDSEKPRETVLRFREKLAPGSFLGFSHVTRDDHPQLAQPLQDLYTKSSNPLTMRSREQVSELFSGFELVDPGLVYVPEWHPDSPEDIGADPSQSILYGAVGRKV